jgi:molecular chaperone GrpE
MKDHTTSKNSNNNVTDEQAINETKQTECTCEPMELEVCKAEVAQLKEKFIRVSADLQNFQARVAKERVMWAREAQSDLILGFLSVLDNFDRALAEHHKQNHDEKFSVWLEGFELIGKNLDKFLKDKGVQEIDSSTIFDPEFHEAIAHIAVPEKKPGEIIETTQKGYLFKDVVIRPAKVVVAK